MDLDARRDACLRADGAMLAMIEKGFMAMKWIEGKSLVGAGGRLGKLFGFVDFPKGFQFQTTGYLLLARVSEDRR